MKLSSMTLAAAVAATAISFAGPLASAPLSQPLTLKSANVGVIEQVQYRRWHRGGNWIGPAAGFAAGLAIGGSIGAYGDGYYAYGAAPGYGDPGYTYGVGPGWYGGRAPVGRSPQYSSCTGDRVNDSAFPGWYCAE